MAAARPDAMKRGRVLSFNSNKSEKTHRSGASGHKTSLSESHDEKVARHLHTKADPTLAINEAQPAMVAALEKSNLASLRDVQHKDQYGNVISEPDISNPTRYRFERPLDTIRSFEAAVEGSWNTRRMSTASYARTEEASQGGFSRRGSYFGPAGGNNGYNRYSEGGNYWNRQSLSRPDSFVDNYGGAGANQPYSPHYPYNNHYGGRPRQRYSERMHSDYGNGAPNVYPQQGYQRSYDNVTAGSVNSSMDRLQQAQQTKPAPDSFGFNGFGPGPQNLQISTSNNQSAPVPPPHGVPTGPVSRKAVPGAVSTDPYNGGPVGGTPVNKATSKILRKNTDASDTKRKSWFKKRFSKS
ncbi:hypothetical protein TSTA_003950 [Paecilomyces variotii No. 5]|uniref:DUF2406 domain protein n=1 Tax=Byssochlamys spectabilis (strain No. 5 / NBRC 109023) TaxID=1356009 RepID=V5GC80_BYSSN|nr:hypothetical protein TSTA_003950 [Paecilomyces variotii No. 5]